VLGAFSGINNFGAVIGSLFSGFISFYLGYATDFAASGALMVVSFYLLRSSLGGAGVRDGLSGI